MILSLLITAIYSQSILSEGRPGAPEGRDPASSANVSHMEGVRVQTTRDGERQWVLLSSSVEMAGGRARLRGVDAEVMGIDMKVRAPEGEYDMDQGGLRLSGGVNMTGEGYSVETAGVRLDPSSGELVSEDLVVMEGKGFRVKGSGLRAAGQQIRLLNDVTAVLY